MIDWKFVNVYDLHNEHHSVYVRALYDLLKERTDQPKINISHKTLPEYHNHVDFVESQPYDAWYIIVNYGVPTDIIGMMYLTDRKEIGVQVAKQYQKRGYAKDILSSFINENPGIEFLANINIDNEISKKLFESLGFELVPQVTYKRKLST